MGINMQIDYKHYKYWYRDISKSKDAYVNGGEPYATIRTWAYVPANEGSLEGVEEYASYWHLKWGSYDWQDVTELHNPVFKKAMEKANETQSNEQIQSGQVQEIPVK